MNYWLFKSEPDEYSIDDLKNEPSGVGIWDGIRNFQARNLIRDKISPGDGVLIYHSSCRKVGVSGYATVVTQSYPDPSQFDLESDYYDPKSSVDQPRWYCVDIKFKRQFQSLYLLSDMKKNKRLSNMVLFKQGRLSIQPVQPDEWQEIINHGNNDPEK